MINKNEKITIRGITEGKIHTLGTIIVDIKFDNVIFEQKFQVVEEFFDIPTQGIIGKDFLKPNNFCIDFNKMTIHTKIDEIEISAKIHSEIEQDTTLLPPNSEVFRIFKIESNEYPCLVSAQNINETTRIATTIVYNPTPWIRVINISDKTQKIKTNSLYCEPINKYKIFSISHSEKNEKYYSESRLSNLKEKISKNIPDHITKKLIPICLEYADIFHINNDTPTLNNFYSQSLKVTDFKPVYIKNYRLPQSQKDEIKRQVNELFKNDLIEMCVSNYNSPLIVVPKKSETNEKKWRMCVDYKLLNKKLIPDKFPLARIDEIHDNLGRAKYFSILDLHAGYHQIPLEKESRPLTAFSTDTGFYQWKVLPFGINIAPASFSRMMTMAFSKLNPERVLIYMDDLIVIGFNEKSHIENLTLVFKTCRKYNLKLNAEKCKFFKTEVTFLGHICTTNGLLPDNRKINTIKNYPKPKDKNEVKRFVAFVNYYRRFIPYFAVI